MSSKPKIVKDYDKLPDSVQEQIKLVYPSGFSQHLISFKNKENETRYGLPFETDDVYYLVRMNKATAQQIIEDDPDYDEDGELKDKIKEEYQDKYSEIDYLSLNSNEDNEFSYDNEEEEDDDDDY